MQQSRLTARDERVRACWRVHACSAGVCVGVQVFLTGAGASAPLGMNAAWICALCAPVSAALTTFFCHRALRNGGADGRLLRTAVCLCFLLNAVFAAASLISLAGQSLLVQAQEPYMAASALAAAFFCTLSGQGLARVFFLMRFALPGLLAVLCALALPFGRALGLFPLLGAGLKGVFAGCACMLGAAFPALLLLDVPEGIGKDVRSSLPDAWFFVWRTMAGAAGGAALLFALALGRPYSSAAADIWGERLLISGAGTDEGLARTGLTALQVMAILLLTGHMLLGAKRSLLLALPRIRHDCAALILCTAVLAAVLYALIAYDLQAALWAAPCLSAALLLAPLAARKRRERHER